MKKVLTIGLMLLVCAGFVFAVDSDEKKDTLQVKLEITESTVAEWFTDKNSISNSFTGSDDPQEVSLAPSGDKYTATAYPAVKTNSGTAVTMYIYGTKLKGEDSNSIDLSAVASTDSEDMIAVTTATTTWDEESINNEDYFLFTEPDGKTGQRVVYGIVNFSIDTATYNKANADTYSADIYLQIQPNQA